MKNISKVPFCAASVLFYYKPVFLLTESASEYGLVERGEWKKRRERQKRDVKRARREIHFGELSRTDRRNLCFLDNFIASSCIDSIWSIYSFVLSVISGGEPMSVHKLL